MGHRKDEITGYANEWDFPHLAELELLPPAMRTWLGVLLPRRTYSPLWPTERRTPAIAEGLPVSRREPAAGGDGGRNFPGARCGIERFAEINSPFETWGLVRGRVQKGRRRLCRAR
jgi:hypothetical protein